jgi:lysophospholipase L1-like esterase
MMVMIALSCFSTKVLAQEVEDAVAEASSASVEVYPAADPRGKDFVMAALGDSITSGFNVETFFATRSLSWATGTDPEQRVYSHFWRLKAERPNQNLVVTNAAVTGSIAAVLPLQALAVAWRRPDYATILIGHNDACHWKASLGDEIQLQAFRLGYMAAIETLIYANPNVKILMVPPVSMVEVYKMKREGQCVPKVNLERLMCPALMGPPSIATPESVRRVLGARQMIVEEVERIAALYPRNVRFASQASEASVTPEEISSVDCFHPSTAGQNALAESTWQTVGEWLAK